MPYEYLPDGAEPCSEQILKQKLKDHFGDDIIITTRHGKTPVVSKATQVMDPICIQFWILLLKSQLTADSSNIDLRSWSNFLDH